MLLDLEDLLAREEGVLFLVLVMLLSLLHSSTIMGMVRVQSMCLPLFWVGNGFLGLALYVCLTHSARFGAKTLSVWVSVSLLEESQVNTEDLLDVIVLRIRLLLKLRDEFLSMGPNLSRGAGSTDIGLNSVPILTVGAESINESCVLFGCPPSLSRSRIVGPNVT